MKAFFRNVLSKLHAGYGNQLIHGLWSAGLIHRYVFLLSSLFLTKTFVGRTGLVLGCVYMSMEKQFLPAEAYSPEYCMFTQVCNFHYIISL